MCFSAGGIENFLLWLVFFCVLIGVLKILLPWILSLAGIGVSGPVSQIINVIVIGLIICVVIVIVFTVFECLPSMRSPLLR